MCPGCGGGESAHLTLQRVLHAAQCVSSPRVASRPTLGEESMKDGFGCRLGTDVVDGVSRGVALEDYPGCACTLIGRTATHCLSSRKFRSQIAPYVRP